MPLRLENDVLFFEGACTVEEVETLHEQVRDLGPVTIDVAAASHLHTAVVQLLMGLSGPVRGVGGDPVLRACFGARAFA